MLDVTDALPSASAGQLVGEVGGDVLTKAQLGADYGLKAYSAIGKEWDEQTAAFCEYVTGKTVEEVDKGNVVTQTAAEGFNQIIERLDLFAQAAKGANESAVEQARVLNQVEEGIEQISSVTQQNATSSEECSAVSEELAVRATELNGLVSKFSLFRKK